MPAVWRMFDATAPLKSINTSRFDLGIACIGLDTRCLLRLSLCDGAPLSPSPHRCIFRKQLSLSSDRRTLSETLRFGSSLLAKARQVSASSHPHKTPLCSSSHFPKQPVPLCITTMHLSVITEGVRLLAATARARERSAQLCTVHVAGFLHCLPGDPPAPSTRGKPM